MNLKEKFDAGYKIEHADDGTIAVQVIVKKTDHEDKYIMEFSDGETACYNDKDDGVFLICTPPKQVEGVLLESKDDKLFTAAVAAMQGMLGSERVLKMFGSDNEMPIKELIARDAFNYAEALIKEGKQRGHL